MIWHSDPKSAILNALGTHMENGLSAEIVRQRQQETESELRAAHPFCRFGKALARTLRESGTLTVLFISLVCFAVAIYRTMRGTPESTAPAAYVGIAALIGVLLRAVVWTVANRTLFSVTRTSGITARVIRGGQACDVPAEQLVTGDILLLRAQSHVPADCRLLVCEHLICDESAVTGEVHIEKDAEAILSPITPLTKRCNMVYAGSCIESGSATAVVVETGTHTELCKLTSSSSFFEQSFFSKITATHKKVGIVLFLLCVLIGVGAWLLHVPLTDAVLFSAALFTLSCGWLPTICLSVWAAGLKQLYKREIVVRQEKAVRDLADAELIAAGKSEFLFPSELSLVCGCAGERILDMRTAQGELGKTLLRLATLCVDESNPSAPDRAILACAKAQGTSLQLLHEEYPALATLPLDTKRRRMLSVHLIAGEKVVIVKGAPDRLLPLCKDVPASTAETVSNMEREAMQVLAVAYRYVDEVSADLSSAELEQDLRFAGLLGFSAPASPKTVALVQRCLKTGIQPAMISGDSRDTVCAVAQEIGLTDKAESSPFVRAECSEEEVCRLAENWKQQGLTTVFAAHTRAVCDAASVGCVAKDAPDALKGAADVLLPNTSFLSLCHVVALCRGIFGRLRCVCRLWYGYAFSLLLLTVASLLSGNGLPLSAPALSFLLLGAAGILPFALCMDYGNVRAHFPPSAKSGGRTRNTIGKILWSGALTAVAAIVAPSVVSCNGNSAAIRFVVLTLSLLWQTSLTLVSPAVLRGRRTPLVWAGLGTYTLTFLAVSLLFPPLSSLLGLSALTAAQAGTTVAFSLLAALLSEAVSFLTRKSKH